MTGRYTRDELAARLVRAGELEVSGESPEEVDSYFDTENFAFHGPPGSTPGYLMLRPLLDDVPDDDMCGVTVNQVFPVNDRLHPLHTRAISGIPDVQAGDSVWWHCDMVHSVAPVQNQQGWGNVMYIPAAPWCARNETYAAAVRQAFRTGSSPRDFPAEHYESTWDNRFKHDDLNAIGRSSLGQS